MAHELAHYIRLKTHAGRYVFAATARTSNKRPHPGFTTVLYLHGLWGAFPHVRKCPGAGNTRDGQHPPKPDTRSHRGMTSSIAMPISPGSGAEPLAQSKNIPMRTEARIVIPAPPTPTQHTHKEIIQLPTLSLSSTMIKRA